MSKERQLTENINYVVGEYYNSMIEDPDAYPIMTEDECLDYLRQIIFDIKVNRYSIMVGKGVCDEIKSLGDEYINDTIIKLSKDIITNK